MPRRNFVPSYRLHRASGQAIVTIPKPGGAKQDVYLGRYGTPESRDEYARVISCLEVRGPVNGKPGRDATVNEVCLAFLEHARTYYIGTDGKPTGEFGEYKTVIREVRILYGSLPAADFGPLALKAVRQRLIDQGNTRGVVNQRTGRVKRIFKWATAEELVPPSTFHGLTALSGLRMGRTMAAEAAPVLPVDDGRVVAIQSELTPTLKAMVQFQRLTGCRPGEVCRLRAAEIDRSREIWIYRPAKHKTSHHGRSRAIAIGPKARGILEPYLASAGPDGFAFRPSQSRTERYAMKRAARKSPVQPSQICRAKPKSERVRPTPPHFDPGVYAQSVRDACDRAGVERWHPNQLRHSAATEARSRFGLEAAQVLLGHAKADVTQVYAERDEALAAKVAAELG